jgi:hypothetical protein
MTTQLLTILPFLFIACDAEMQEMKQPLTEENQRNGRIMVPLTATSTSGANYIVELSYLSLESEFDSMDFDLQEETEFDVTLKAGTWDLFVGEYALYKEGEDGEYHMVEAELVGENPKPVEIFAGATTRAQLNFRAQNEDIVTDGHLALEILIDDSEAEIDPSMLAAVFSPRYCDPCDQACVNNIGFACYDNGGRMEVKMINDNQCWVHCKKIP